MAKSKLKKGRIDFGDVEMSDAEYVEAQNPKVRTTIFLEADLISAYKKAAIEQGVKYQQLMRETLRSALEGQDSVEARLEALEKKVFKKRA